MKGLTDLGLLIARVGLGGMFAYVHGWPKLIGGPEKWAKLGSAMANFGVTAYPEFWGFMAAFAEFGGGIALVLGLFWRPMVALLTFTMLVAAVKHLTQGDTLGQASHAIENGVVLAGLLLTGPGAFTPAFRRPKKS